MGRDKMNSPSLHSFHEEHAEPSDAVPAAEGRSIFETLVRDMLAQLGEDPTREGLRQTPARVEASLKWLTRGYHMSVPDVIGDALYRERHENLVCVRDIEIYSLCEHHLLPFFGKAHVARSEEHTSELQSQSNLVCRLLLEKKKFKPLMFLTLMMPSLVFLLLLWLKLVSHFLKVRCQLALLPFLKCCVSRLNFVATRSRYRD